MECCDLPVEEEDAILSGTAAVVFMSLLLGAIILCVFCISLWHNKRKNDPVITMHARLASDIEKQKRESVRLKEAHGEIHVELEREKRLTQRYEQEHVDDDERDGDFSAFDLDDDEDNKGRKKHHRSLRDAARTVGMISAAVAPSMRKKKIIKKAFSFIDADHSGHVDYEEFLAACGREADPQAVRELFDLLDEDHSGTVEKKELVHALKHDDRALELAQSMPGLAAVFDAQKHDADKAKADKRAKRAKDRAAAKHRRSSRMKRHRTLGTIKIVKKEELRGKKRFKQSVKKLIHAKRLLDVKKTPGPPTSAAGSGRSGRRASIVEPSAMPHLGHASKHHHGDQEKSTATLSNAMALRSAIKMHHHANTAKSKVRKRRSKRKVEQEVKLHHAFQTIDESHDGHIDFEEFVQVCESEDRVAVLKLFELIDEDHSGTIEEDELVHCMQTNKVARGMAKQFPSLQALVGASREERRARARARRRSTKKKGKSRRRSSKKKRHAARPSLTRKRSGTINVDQLDDLARASAVHDAAQQQQNKGSDKWIEKTDPKSRRRYWVNQETHTSTWHNPFEEGEGGAQRPELKRRNSRRGTLQAADFAAVHAAAAE